MTNTNRIAVPSRATSQRNESPSSNELGLSWVARIYVVGTCLSAILILLQASVLPVSDPAALAFFFVLSGLAQLLPIRFHKDASVSMSMAIAIAAILVLGPTYAVWVKLASGLVHYFRQIRPKKRPFYRSAVTTSILVIAVRAASLVYLGLGGKIGQAIDPIGSLPALIVAGFGYYVINTFLISFAMALEQRHGFWELFGSNGKWLTLNMASMTPLGLGIALIYEHIGWNGLTLFMLPVAMAWYSFRLYGKSIEDVRKANDDLKRANERLNVMYEVARTFSGSLRFADTLNRSLASVKLMGYQNGFAIGPLSTLRTERPNRRATDPSLAKSVFTYTEVETKRALTELTISLANTQRIIKDKLISVSPAEHRIVSSQRTLSTIVLIPFYQGDELCSVVGIEAFTSLSEADRKELFLFRSMSESALQVAFEHERAEQDAMMDTRTGLYNHRFFQEALQKELVEALQRNNSFAFMMIDINNFKVFNDTYGHQIGDGVLEVIGRLMRENIREEDIACRYGGDELCVLLPYADRSTAMEIAARVDRAICNFTFEARRTSDAGIGDLEQLHVRVSIGVATFPESASTPAGLIDVADRGCYRAKALGGGVATADDRRLSKANGAKLQLVK